MVGEYASRSAGETERERQFLERRMAEVEQGLGKVAARRGTPSPLNQEMAALDRARQLVAEMRKQVRVRPLEAALTARLAWLDRAEARRARDDGEPKPVLHRIALDRRLLHDLLRAWQAEGS